VERALRVLDGAVLVVCAVGGVQSQTNTVDRQMKRYKVPRIAFINKMDRMGSDPWKIVGQLRDKLQLNAAAIQVPIGLEDKLEGLIDLVTMKAASFKGEKGEVVEWGEIPANLVDQCKEKRLEMIERLAEVDEAIGEKFILEEPIPDAELVAGLRRATIANTFVPVTMGSAYKNKGVQLLLNRVHDLLPDPTEVQNTALNVEKNEEEVVVKCDSNGPFVALAFKLQESPFGQLTYLRVYSGKIKKGETVVHINSGKKIKVPRLVRMHSDEMEDVSEAKAGEIVVMFGVDCATGDTFTDGKVKYSMTSMHVPDPVMSLALSPKSKGNLDKFSKALNRFTREDPTFRVGFDDETKQTVISGMGELHLQIYVERIKREYGVECDVGQPRVNYRESITRKATFDYQHKKQSGGQGQYGRVMGRDTNKSLLTL
jgi:elongation factor G